MKEKIQVIGITEKNEIFTNQANSLGMFLITEPNGSFTAIDNKSGEAWTENFKHEAAARQWLHEIFTAEDAHAFDEDLSKPNAHLSAAQKRFIELDKRKAEMRQFAEDYKAAVEAVVAESGLDKFFQDAEGVVYKTHVPDGKFVYFDKYDVVRTRREGEAKGSLSMSDARAAGFQVEGK